LAIKPFVGEMVVVVTGAVVTEGDDDLPLLHAPANNTPKHTIEHPRLFTAPLWAAPP